MAEQYPTRFVSFITGREKFDSTNFPDTTDDPGQYRWTPGPIAGLTVSTGFHFELAYADGIYYNSGAVFITNGTTTTASTSSRPATSRANTASSMTKPTNNAKSSPAASNTSKANAKSNDHNSEALRVGLGAGLGLGIPLLLLIGGFMGWMLFRRRAAADQQHQPTGEIIHEAGKRRELHADSALYEAPKAGAKRELQGDHAWAELPDDGIIVK